MLKIRLNGGNSEVSYETLDVDTLSYSGDDNEYIKLTCPNHRMLDGDIVRFTRESSFSDMHELRAISVYDENDFMVEAFPPYQINYSGMTIEKIATGFDKDGNTVYNDAFVLYLTDEPQFATTHDFSEINGIVYDGYYDGEIENTAYKCPTDTVFYNGFVYNLSGDPFDDYNRYVFTNDPKECLNYKNVEISYYNETLKCERTISGGIIPVDEQGNDIIDKVYFFYYEDMGSGNIEYTSEEHEILRYIYANSPSLILTAKDNRFFEEKDGELNFVYNSKGIQESYVEREVGNYRVSIPINDVFSNSSLAESAHNNLLDETIKENTPKPVDYEKRQFEPVIYNYNDTNGDEFNFTDNNFINVDEIVFNLHFREKHDSEDEGKEWVSDDTDGWNNYYMSADTEGNTVLVGRSGINIEDADLLGYLNFKDVDVYYQRNKLKKSFIRILFYDSPDRSNQVLQYYSTIFFDTGDAFSKYVTLKSTNEGNDDYYGVNEDSTVYVLKESSGNKDLRLCARFRTNSKNDMQHSSDGFYAYLFPSLLEGRIPSDLYMKIEFNHAKYGRTIPFILPTYEYVSGNKNRVLPLDPTTPSTVGSNKYYFPIHYMLLDETTEEYSEVDYQRALRDMYINVKIKYDDDNNRYVWFFPRPKQSFENTGQIVLNLFEPRLNGYEKVAKDTRYENISVDSESGTFHLSLSVRNTSSTNISVTIRKEGVIILDETIMNGGTAAYEGDFDYDTYTCVFSFLFYMAGNGGADLATLQYTKEDASKGYVLKTLELTGKDHPMMSYTVDLSKLLYKTSENKNMLKLFLECS